VNPAHLYIHVPFCLRRCSYCDFAVTATRTPPIAAWLDAVARELELRAGVQGWTAPLLLRTLYIGGGTPSLMGTGAMAGLCRRLSSRAALVAGAEWTVEANPETLTAELAADWLEAGVNRLSLGAQTFHGPSLEWMGRMHGPDGPERALAGARAAGFTNISLDLIFGLPQRLGRDWDADLDRLLELAPAHVSLYGLTAEAATPLGRWVGDGREVMAPEESYAAEYLAAADRLRGAGYQHYEVSNFARPGFESRHNQAYWDDAAYIGLGPGAHSYLPPRRIWNVRDWNQYRTVVDSGRLPQDGAETVDSAARGLERVWLALRTSAGLTGLTAAQQRLAERWYAQGWAVISDGRVTLTPRGWLLLDRLAVDMDDTAAAAAATLQE
jgi:oxygen-independent coproporphyrinogen-3 oxidase